MSTIAKVMVVVVFALSVAFTVISGQLFAKRERLRAEYTKLKGESSKEISSLKGDKEQLLADKAKLQQDVDNKKDDVERLTNSNSTLKQQSADQKEQITKKDSQLAAITTTVGQLNDNLKNKDERQAALEKDLNGTRDKLRETQEVARQKELEAKKLAQEAKEAKEKQTELEIALKDARTKLEMVMTKGALGQSYNVGGRAERTNLEVVETICDLLDERMPMDGDKKRRDLITFVTDRPGHDRRYAIDPAKIENDLGWKAQESFETGLAKTVDWYLANEWWWKPIRDGRYAGERLGKG